MSTIYSKSIEFREMEFPVVAASISLLLCILLSLYFHRSRRTDDKLSQTPPGSFGFPFIGETLDFLSVGKNGEPEKFVLDRAKKYNSNIFKTSLFGERMVVLASQEGNKFLFSNENKLVKGWWPRHFDTIFNPSRVNNNATVSRQIFLPHVKRDVVQKYVPFLDSITKQHFKKYWEGRESVSMFHLTKHLVFALAVRVFLEIEDQELVERLEKPFSELVNGLLTMPVNLPGTQLNRAIKARNKLLGDFKDLIKQWKSDSSKGKESLIRSMLQENYSDEEILFKILILLTATYDTTSSAMAGITMFLLDMPDVYDKILEEHREIVRSKKPGEMLNWEDIQKMKYSKNVAAEVLRLYPPAVGGFREALCDFTYDGFLIPKGWKIHWNTNGMHKNPQYFKDPKKFDPLRFEKETPVPYTYVPFGGGPRVCPGQEYAKTTLLVFLHNLATKYRCTKIFPDEKLIYDPVLHPTKDLSVNLHPLKSVS